MDSRERIFKVIKNRELVDRIPWTFNFGATQGFNPGLLARYKKHIGVDIPIAEHFDYDIFPVLDPDGDKSKIGLAELVSGIDFVSNGIKEEDYYTAEDLKHNGYLDAWGIYRYPWPKDETFEVYTAPLKNTSDLKKIKDFPSPTLDEKSLEAAARDIERIKSEKNKMTVLYSGSLYEWTKYIRGEEQLFMDYIANPSIVEAMVEKVAAFTGELARRFQGIGLDVLSFYDDFGAQDRLQVNPKHWRQFIKPAWKKIWDEVRSRDKNTIIFLHSCGCVEEIIPDLIEIGLDVLHPIQPETMDVYKISREYQKDLALWGTISCQKTIPFGTPDDIDREIKERVKKMGSKGGFIVSPANIMGPEIPMENLDAFARACQKYCNS
jgi:uroporphyrinogen decarboxylase